MGSTSSTSASISQSSASASQCMNAFIAKGEKLKEQLKNYLESDLTYEVKVYWHPTSQFALANHHFIVIRRKSHIYLIEYTMDNGTCLLAFHSETDFTEHARSPTVRHRLGEFSGKNIIDAIFSWKKEDYAVLHRNCNNWVEEVTLRLTGSVKYCPNSPLCVD